jgi:hypothetical protein
VEEFLSERSASINRVVRWAGEVNPSLDALGLSPIRVVEAPLHLAPSSRCWIPSPSDCDTWSPPSLTAWRQKGEWLPGGWRSTFLPASGATTSPFY